MVEEEIEVNKFLLHFFLLNHHLFSFIYASCSCKHLLTEKYLVGRIPGSLSLQARWDTAGKWHETNNLLPNLFISPTLTWSWKVRLELLGEFSPFGTWEGRRFEVKLSTPLWGLCRHFPLLWMHIKYLCADVIGDFGAVFSVWSVCTAPRWGDTQRVPGPGFAGVNYHPCNVIVEQFLSRLLKNSLGRQADVGIFRNHCLCLPLHPWFCCSDQRWVLALALAGKWLDSGWPTSGFLHI